MLRPIPCNGMITLSLCTMKLTFVLDQRDSIRTDKNPSVAMMRGAAACVADASKSRIAGRYAIVISPLKKELSP